MAVLLWSCLAALILTFPERSAAQAVVANLSADGTRVPGGYVVPVGGDVTFTCEHNGSFGRSLFWEFAIVDGTATMVPTTALNLLNVPGLSSPATSNTDNPVNITIHNLQLANNGSNVTCQLETEGSPTVILVEGMPSCAMIDVIPRMGSEVTAALSPSGRPWFLPVWFNVTVASSDFPTWTFSTNMSNVNIARIQPMTAYNISVIPCNSFGCNEDCQQYVTNITAALATEGSAGSNPRSRPGIISLNIIIGVASGGIITIVAALASAVLAVWVIKWRREKRCVNSSEKAIAISINSPEGKPTTTTNSASEYAAVRDCMSSLRTPMPDSKSQVPEIRAIDTVGYGEVLHSAPKLQRVRSSNPTSKPVDDKNRTQAASMTTYATVQDVMPHYQSSDKNIADTATMEDFPPPIPPRDSDVAQDLGYAVLPCNEESDTAPPAHNLCSSSTGSLPIETAVDVAQ